MITSFLLALPASLALVLALRLLPLVELGHAARKRISWSLRILRSARISDATKERLLPRYSLAIVILSLKLASALAAMLVVGGGVYGLTLWLVRPGEDWLARLQQPDTLLYLTVLTMAGVWWLGRPRGKTASDYGALDKVLHWLALEYRPLRMMTFEVGQSLARIDDGPIEEAPVFICGLARSGTSILLRLLHAHGGFHSLSYRDMPFVLAPGMWRKVSSGFHKEAVLTERSHGDGLEVGFDTPEAFEEVFWLTWTEAPYRTASVLLPLEPGDEAIEHFRIYVRQILASVGGDQALRYLSKNNNNVLRLQAIETAFPKGRILIPFRSPVDHAISLLRQHELFSGRNDEDPFSLRYMTWLGHHEFGRGHRPFAFAGFPQAEVPKNPEELTYWLAYWSNTYRHILETMPTNAYLISYEGLGRETERTLERLAEILSLPRGALAGLAPMISAQAPRHSDAAIDAPILAEAEAVHRALLTSPRCL